MEAPRTVSLSLALVGITVAALAEAMQVRAAGIVNWYEDTFAFGSVYSNLT